MSRSQRRAMIDREEPKLSLVRQCALLGISRSSLYYLPTEAGAEDLELMALIDPQYLKTPFYGSRRMTVWLRNHGHQVNRKRVRRLMQLIGLEAIYRRPNTSKPNPGHKVYPYLLRGLEINRVNQVWATDITYIPMARGFLYLVAIMDWHSRYVLAWRLSNTLEVDFCVAALEEALSKGRPQIFNTDQGSQFTSEAFTSMLRRKGIRVVSITEHADDSPTGKLMEAIIESVDEFYSENLAQEVVRGMREAASRGFFLGSKAPFGYKRVKVNDGAKERPTLEVDPTTAPIVKGIFESSLRGNGLKEIGRELNDRGITNRGKRWYKGGLHYLLTNEAYTGTAVWGKTAKGEKAQDPVRVEGAWPALVSRELFAAVQEAMRDRAPKVQKPGRVGSRFLLSGLLKCGVCGRPYSGQGAKSGQFAYYICGTLFREGAGTCTARYLNAPRVEGFVVEKIRERILNEETIVELVKLVAEEIDAMAGELSGSLEVIEAELGDVRKRLERLYEALETSELTLEVLSPRIFSLRHREEQLEAAREDAETQLEQRRVELPTTEEIRGYVADFREFLQEGSFPERKALIRNFVEGIEVVGDEATLTYTIPISQSTTKTEVLLGGGLGCRWEWWN